MPKKLKYVFFSSFLLMSYLIKGRLCPRSSKFSSCTFMLCVAISLALPNVGLWKLLLVSTFIEVSTLLSYGLVALFNILWQLRLKCRGGVTSPKVYQKQQVPAHDLLPLAPSSQQRRRSRHMTTSVYLKVESKSYFIFPLATLKTFSGISCTQALSLCSAKKRE